MMNQSLLLGSPTIDHQHQGLFALLERLSGLTRNADHEEELSDILGKLTKQLQHHFLTEETVMDRLDMPNVMLKAHHAAHHRIIEELTQLHMESMAGKPRSLETIIADVGRWVYQHMVEYDLDMKPYINGQ
jgi:hemerythrin-like metal-binding protein